MTDGHDEFTFAKIFPGKYRLEAKHAPAGSTVEEDKWCREQSSIDVDVDTGDVEGTLFLRKAIGLMLLLHIM